MSEVIEVYESVTIPEDLKKELSCLETGTSVAITQAFRGMFEQAKVWKEKANSITITDASQVREMKMAREARLALKEIRVSANKKRAELKEDSIRYGKAVQGVYNVLEFLIAPIEKDLEQKEKFAEIQEANRIAAQRQLRNEELAEYQEFVPFGLDVGPMNEEQYGSLLANCKLLMAEKIKREEAIRIAEEERIKKNSLRTARRERVVRLLSYLPGNEPDYAEMTEEQFVVFENGLISIREESIKKAEEERQARAKAEAARKEAEAKAKAERERMEAEQKRAREEAEKKLAAERAKAEAARKEAEELRKKAEQERIEKEKEEAARIRQEKEEKERIASMGDKGKVEQLLSSIMAIQIPEVSSEKYAQLVHQVKEHLSICIEKIGMELC